MKEKDSLAIAHISKNDGRIQPLEDHLHQVAQISSFYAGRIGLAKIGELMGLLHDLGKYSDAFQAYIQGNGREEQDEEIKSRVDHSTAGGQWIWHNKEKLDESEPQNVLLGQILSLVIISHHSGLIDCLSANGEVKDAFLLRIQKADMESHFREVKAKLPPSLAAQVENLLSSGEISSELQRLLKRILQKKEAKEIRWLKVGLLARFLLSCLIEGDHSDAADFEYPENEKIRQRKKYEAWEVLIDRLEKKIAEFTDPSPLNQRRREISDQCRKRSATEPGVYTLSVPTGGGKTLASLRFALHHAQKHNLERIIYSNSFVNVLDQNVDITRSILEPEGVLPGSIVLEHHSNLAPEKNTWQNKVLSENWDAPVVYTTNVQILEALFGSGTRKIRRMNQLACSVIIFDEIQALPIQCVHLFANAINFLVEQCGSTVVLCTASQPLLDQVNAKKGAITLTENSELISGLDQIFEDLRRVELLYQQRDGGWDYEEISEFTLAEAEKSGSVLVIVNTKDAARQIYQRCENRCSFSVYHLSTGMCPAHRREILAEVIQKRKQGEKLICVSTQLIEAGVDIDFACVIRSFAGLDSVAQAAGRCNRNQKQEELGRVHLVKLREEKISKGLEAISRGQSALQRVLDDYQENPEVFRRNLIGPAAIQRYFTYYFYEQKKEMSYPLDEEENLVDLLSTNRCYRDRYIRQHNRYPPVMLKQAFQKAAQNFQVIQAATQGVIVPYGTKGKDLISRLRAKMDTSEFTDLLQQAQPYSVNLFPYQFEKLEKKGVIVQIREGSGIYTVREGYYDMKFGVSKEMIEEEDFLHV